MTDKKLENQILWVVLSLTLFALFIVIFETFEFNIDRVSLLIATFGAIGAVTAAAAAARSANIARIAIDAQQKQFEKSIEPFLVPNINKFTLHGEADSLDIVIARWDKKRPEEHISKGLEIPLINVASGVAKNIVVDFKINNYKNIVYKYNNTSSSVEKEKLKLRVVENVSNFNADFVAMRFNSAKFITSGRLQASNFNKQEFPFIHKDMQEQIKIDIPELFIVLTNLSLYNIFSNYSEIEPELIVKITCQDLANKEYEFNYCISLYEAHFDEDLDNSKFEIKMSVAKKV